MKSTLQRHFKLPVLSVLGLILAVVSTPGQPALRMRGIPEDWTHHHLVFSNPGTFAEALAGGRLNSWLRIVSDPRYIQQQARRGVGAKPVIDAPAASKPKPKPPGKMKKDWAEGLGTGTVAPNTFPAKWSFSTRTASCANDYVVYPTGAAGGGGQASIIAYYELYSGCTSSPSVNWAYNTGGTVTLSPVLSLDGTQVAFIQTSGSVASLAVLRMPSPGTSGQGSLSSPASPTSESASNYPGCSAPCMTAITLSGSPNDTWSHPWYDYWTDSLYVGDSAGVLHKFNPVFNGTSSTPPAEISGSGWPLTLNSGYNISSPVYDGPSGCVFVGDVNNGSTSGGYFYSVESGVAGSVCTSTTASVHATSAQLGTNCYGINDAPLVDSTASTVYVFAQDSHISPHYYNAVFQFSTAFTSSYNAVAYSTQTLGGGNCAAYSYFFAGSFDNTYYTSSTPSSPSGYLYYVGDSAGPSYLTQVGISGNQLCSGSQCVQSPNAVAQLSYFLASGYGSPLTEFCNNGAAACTSTSGTDYLFLSVYYGNVTNCTGISTQGCVLNFTVNSSGSATLGTSPLAVLEPAPSGAYGGIFVTGGIIVDNALSSPAGTSQIYFQTRYPSATNCTGSGSPSGTCAVQASQAAP